MVWLITSLGTGTVHLRYPQMTTCAARLQIDAAPAVVGFETRAGRSYPQIEGVVVLAEHSELLVRNILGVDSCIRDCTMP